jgi:hypothetical protein
VFHSHMSGRVLSSFRALGPRVPLHDSSERQIEWLQVRPGRHCRSTLTLAAIACHPSGIYTVVLLSLLALSVEMTVSPWATAGGVQREGRPGVPRPGRHAEPRASLPLKFLLILI